MLRQFLTLLAVISGLTALAEPAHARVASVENVAMVQQASACIAVSGVVSSRLTNARQSRRMAEFICPLAAVPVQVPTIMLRIDRAHE